MAVEGTTRKVKKNVKKVISTGKPRGVAARSVVRSPKNNPTIDSEGVKPGKPYTGPR